MNENSRPNDWGVLLLAHGAPDKLEDIPEFLLQVRGGRPLPPSAVEEITRRYALIGGGSPLLAHTRRQAEALAPRLKLPVYVGMRNWHPFIAEAVERIACDAICRLLVICLAPHNSRTSIGLYRNALDEALTRIEAPPKVTFIEDWHTEPFLIQAFAEKLRSVLTDAREAAGRDVPVILTAHSVPERTIAAGDPYDQQVRETAARVAETAGCQLWSSAYQSQGMTGEPWLGPTVESVLEELAGAGHRHVIVAPVGFLCDHVEVLYDIDIALKDYARTKGLRLWRTESLNDSPLLIEALASLVLPRVRLRASTTAS
ncbi:MAG: ferrochelatase [Acidobacteria bacterium]|nr:ferrochelatase [Acidobacteriota bacterium]